MGFYVRPWRRESVEKYADWVAEHPDEDFTNYIASNRLPPGLGSGSVIYVISFYDGELHVHGRMTAGLVTDSATAGRLLTQEVWPAEDHVIAAPGAASGFVDVALPKEGAESVRFLDPSGGEQPPKHRSDGALDHQSFRSIREISPATASLFDRLIGLDLAAEGAATVTVVVRDDQSRERRGVLVARCHHGQSATLDNQRSTADPELLDDPLRVAEVIESAGLAELATFGLTPIDWQVVLDARVSSSGLSAPGSALYPTGSAGTPPLLYPLKGSLARGFRALAEVPGIPPASVLSKVGLRAQRALLRMVEDAGGRLEPARSAIKLSQLEPVIEAVYEWIGLYADRQDDGMLYDGRPGIWHAFDRLVPLQEPNRWTPFRLEVFEHLQRHRGWVRKNPPRGATWWIPDA